MMLGAVVLIALNAHPCASAFAASAAAPAANNPAALGVSARAQRGEVAVGARAWPAASGEDGDWNVPVDDDIQKQLGQIDELVSHMSQFQVPFVLPAPSGPSRIRAMQSCGRVALNTKRARNRKGVQCWRRSWRSAQQKIAGSSRPSNQVSPSPPLCSLLSCMNLRFLRALPLSPRTCAALEPWKQASTPPCRLTQHLASVLSCSSALPLPPDRAAKQCCRARTGNCTSSGSRSCGIPWG